MKGKSLYLLDGSAIFYRAHFAFIRNPLINSKGEDTSATFGFVNSIMKIIRDEKPDYLAVVFDTKTPTFRHKIYPEYKATRTKMPEELIEQLPRIREATEVLGLPSLELEGYEADDIIGTVAVAAEKIGMAVWIVSGDKDMFQLVTDNIKIYNSHKGSKAIKLDRDGVVEKFGVSPHQVIDALALMGDASDNVKGVPGIGPKTAISLLEQFGSLDNILKSSDLIKSQSTRRKIMDNVENAELCRKLVTIDINAPIKYSFESIKYHEPDFKKAKKFFMEMEFFRLIDDLAKQTGVLDLQLNDQPEKAGESSLDAEYICIENIKQLKQVISELSKKKAIAVDTETTSINALNADLVGVSLCGEPGLAYYIPLNHEDESRNLPQKEAYALLSKFLTNKKVQKIGQNLKYDLEVLHRAGLNIDPISFDTMLASYLINPSGRHGLDALALEHFSYRMQPISELIGTGKKQISFALVDVERAYFYAAEDADYTFRLFDKLAPKLNKLNLNKLYYDIELPLIEVLTSMEEEGVRVDADYLGEMSKELQVQLDKLTGDIYIEAGQEFNINSTQQLSKILFEIKKLPTKGKTAKKTGYSTDVKVLEELSKIDDLPRLMLDYRQLTKLKNTYIDAIPMLISNETGRVHTSFNQTITTTGRLSSTDPNLQNIPVRTEIGRRIRMAFIPRDKNYQLLVADYSQMELRILAHFSGDKTLINAFKNNEDIHTRTAAEVYGADMNDVTPEMRRAAKTANFAIIYGVSAFGLSQQTGMDVTRAKEFIETYFKRYPGIKTYMDKTIESAKKSGSVSTLFNRIRYLPEINSPNFQVRQFAERTAINTPIQGTAADMIKVAMIDIHKKLRKLKSKMILQVHDELVFDAHKEEIEQLKNIVKDGMERAVKLEVPVIADIGLGDNWLDAK